MTYREREIFLHCIKSLLIIHNYFHCVVTLLASSSGFAACIRATVTTAIIVTHPLAVLSFATAIIVTYPLAVLPFAILIK